MSFSDCWIVVFFFFCLERDHAGGNEKMKQLVPGIKVYGGSLDKVKGCTDAVDNGDTLSLGHDVNILALHTPWYVCFYFNFDLIGSCYPSDMFAACFSHTKGHISYYVTGKDGETPAVFTGDTLVSVNITSWMLLFHIISRTYLNPI